MENNTYIKFSICLSDIPKELIYTADNGKKYISGQITERREKGQFGETHAIALRYKASDGNFYTQYIGKGETATFGGSNNNRPLPPPPASAKKPAESAASAAASASDVVADSPQTESPEDDLPF